MSLIRDDDDPRLPIAIAALALIAAVMMCASGCGGALAGGTIDFKPPTVSTDPVYEFGVVACAVSVAPESPCPVPIAGAKVEVQAADGWGYKLANADGYVLYNSSLPFSAIRISADGYRTLTASIEPAKLDHTNRTYSLVPLLASAGETGPLRVDGLVFRRADGSIFQWRGATDFLLFSRFLAGEDLDPVLSDRIAAGANLVRVLGMVDSFAHLWPQEHADYYDRLGAFLDRVAARGLRVEFVVFADAQIIMPAAAVERAHLARVGAVLAVHPGHVLETANEPFKNIPGGDVAAAALCRTVAGRGFPVASGAYTAWPPLAPCDYGTTHSDRKPEWPRTAKDLLDLSDPTRTPWVSDEPTGFAEVADGDKRSTSATDAAFFAGTAALMGAGATFHADGGVTSTLWGPVQRAAAVAFYGAMRWVPAEAQLWPYQRGGDPGTGGVGNMPLEHDDALALRTFCKGDGSTEWCVAIRPADAWRAVPRDGWHVVEEPWRGFVRLAR